VDGLVLVMHAEELDSVVLETLCEEPGPWTREEIKREFRGKIGAVDALNRLLARGLAVKLEGDFFAATAAGRYACRVGQEAP
jgi:hypothetical protein